MNVNDSIINVPVAASVEFDKTTGNLICTEKTEIKLPPEDDGGPKIACSERSLQGIKHELLKVQKEAKKSTAFIVDLFSALFGGILALLATAWITISPYSKPGSYIYFIGIPLLLISGFLWLWFKRRPGIDINERIDFILEKFPKIENAEAIRKKNEL